MRNEIMGVVPALVELEGNGAVLWLWGSTWSVHGPCGILRALVPPSPCVLKVAAIRSWVRALSFSTEDLDRQRRLLRSHRMVACVKLRNNILEVGSK